MSYSAKDRLYLLIQSNPDLAIYRDAWTDDILRHHSIVQVRSTNSHRAPVVIKLSQKGSYMPVLEWAQSHRINIQRAYDELGERLSVMKPIQLTPMSFLENFDKEEEFKDLGAFIFEPK